MAASPMIMNNIQVKGSGLRLRFDPEDHPVERIQVKSIVRKQKRKVRPTSFNLEDPFESGLHDWIGDRCFSTYVKRLIWEDQKSGGLVLHGISLPAADSMS